VVTVGGVTTVTRWAYDGSNAWATLDGSSGLVTRQLFGNVADQLFAQQSASGTPSWYLTDRQGSTRLVVDNSGALQDALWYSGFGQVTSETAPTAGFNYQYASGLMDRETGLELFWHRYLDPVTLRFTSEDPTGLTPDINPFRYAGNGPTDATDPTGLEERPIDEATRQPMTSFESMLNGRSAKPLVPAGSKDRATNYFNGLETPDVPREYKAWIDAGSLKQLWNGTSYEWRLVNPKLLSEFQKLDVSYRDWANETDRKELNGTAARERWAYEARQAETTKKIQEAERAKTDPQVIAKAVLGVTFEDYPTGSAVRSAFYSSLEGDDRQWARLGLNGEAAVTIKWKLDPQLAQLIKDMGGTSGATLFSPGEVLALAKARSAWQADNDRQLALEVDISRDSALKEESQKAIEEFLGSERTRYEEATPQLTKEDRKKLAPWLYGDTRLFKPGLVAQRDQVSVTFVPTDALRLLQLKQAYARSTILLQGDWVQRRNWGVKFTPAQTAADVLAWYAEYGETDRA